MLKHDHSRSHHKAKLQTIQLPSASQLPDHELKTNRPSLDPCDKCSR